MLSKLSSLYISSLRKLDDQANKFYDWKHDLYEAALLIRCYTQHVLRPYIDSEINHIRHFIKIPFINKGIEFIDLPSIFRDNAVLSSIPSCFENTESPIICYKYNKPIRNTILNFNKLVSDLDIETSFPDSWECKDSKFCYQPACHIITGNLKIIVTLESVQSFLKDLNTDFLPTLTISGSNCWCFKWLLYALV